MAKRKKGQKRANLRRGNSATRGKARKVAKGAKRTVAKAKSRRSPVKKAAPKVVRRMKKPVVETVVVDSIDQPVAVTEVEETRKAS